MSDPAPNKDVDARSATESLKRKITRLTLKILVWGRDHLPPVVRTAVGLLFLVGGIFGFLPILGFWMVPLGLALIALDFPKTHKRIHDWMEKMEASLEEPPPEAGKEPAD